MLVEDEAAVRKVVKRTLERSGYRVFEASDGETGLAAVAERRERIDAVVTDMMMPGMDGATFATALAQRRDLEVHHVEAIEQVLAERAFTHGLLEVPV